VVIVTKSVCKKKNIQEEVMKNMKKLVSLITVSSALLMLTAGAARAFTVYNDMGDWASAMGSGLGHTSMLTFGQEPPIVHTGTLIPGVVPGLGGSVNIEVASTQTNPLYGITIPGLNLWKGQVNSREAFGDLNTTTFNFKGSTRAFGGTWNLAEELFGEGLIFNIIYADNSKLQVGSMLDTPAGTFWGIILDEGESPFYKLEISGLGTTGVVPGENLRGVETYTLQDFAYDTVPEPSTFLLIGAGFGGLMLWKRRRQV
jgi:hypothetical protein